LASGKPAHVENRFDLDHIISLRHESNSLMSKHWFVVDWNCCLGAGGEGEVFLGRSLETFELCAIKVSALLDRKCAAEQLERELDRLMRVAGEGVVGLVAWNLEAARPFLVFELAKAGTLADEMKQLKRQARVYHPTRALERTREVLAALAHVHAHGLIHRDVKPANLLRFGNALKLTDFGTGRSMGSVRPEALESQGFVGTRLYAAPEQLQGQEVDERSDLYAAGCILHEMLTGVVPRATGPRLRKYPHALILAQLDELVACLLHEDPARRPQNAADAIARVDSVLESYRYARRVWMDLGLGRSPY
jgi:serine/threonine protein kinase